MATLLLAMAALVWALGREPVARWAAARATQASDGRIVLEGVRGSLYGPLHLRHVRVQLGPVRLEASEIDFDWRPRDLWQRRLTVTRLAAQQATVAPNPQVQPGSRSPGGAPLPLDVAVQSLRIEHLRLDYPGGPYRIAGLTAHGTLTSAGADVQAQAFGDAVQLSAHAAADATAAFEVAVALHELRVAAIVATPVAAVVSGKARVRGRAGAFTVHAALDHSRIGAYPLAGEAQATWEAGAVRDTKAEFVSAGNRVRASGAFGRPGDRLAWEVNAPQLARLGVSFHGELHAHGMLGDTLAAPRVSFTASAKDAQLGGALAVAAMSASGAIVGGIDGPVRATMTASDVRVGALTVIAADMHLAGTRARHALRLTARARDERVAASAQGGWNGRAWQGRVERLQARGRVTLASTGPASLQVSRSAFTLESLAVDVAGGRIEIAQARHDARGWYTRGRADHLALAALRPMLPQLARVRSSLVIGGEWDVAANDRLEGRVRVQRERGDLVLQSEPALPLGLSDMTLQLHAASGALSLRGRLAGARIGVANVEGKIPLTRRAGRFGVAGDARIVLDAHAALPSIAWATLFTKTLVRLDGSVDADVRVRGTLAQPQWGGEVRARDLQFHWPDQGVALTDGEIAARLTGDRLQIETMRFKAGDGNITAHGEAMLREPSLTLHAAARQATVMRLPDREAVASGNADLSWRAGLWRLTGEARVDRAIIELPKHDMPTLSDDVTVVGRTAHAVPSAAPVRAILDVRGDLGKRFYLKGRGLDARLAGNIRLRSAGTGLPTANGTISVAEGTYSAYGQRLSVDRGILNFSGPLDNPGLDLLALRKDQPVEAGVAVTGTALHPIVRLVSQPEVSDSEKLAWLVLGHGLEGSSSGELDVLSGAAGALLARGESVSLQARIAQGAGLDEFRVSGGGGLQQAVVTVGKRVSSRAYVSYEHGLSATSELLKVRYALSKRWSVQTQSGGRDTAVDLFYTWSFD